MDNKLKLYLIDLSLIGLTIALIASRASWPTALVIVALLGYKAFEKYSDKKSIEKVDDSLKDKLASMESRLTMIGLNKRN
jgi:hypothetical protein